MQRNHDFNVSKNSSKYSYTVQSQSSNSSTSKRWYQSQHAKNMIMSTSSAFYALILSIFALVFELAHVLAGDMEQVVRIKDLFMGAYMYGLGILFLLFCYYELYERHQHRSTSHKVQTLIRLGTLKEDPRKNSTDSVESVRLPQEILTAGSLFLRIGCIVFGVIGVVYNGFEVYFCFKNKDCKKVTVLLHFLAIVFIIIQGHFIFCNWKISKTRSHFIARFGTMHLVGANLWTWFRFVLFEETVMHSEIHEAFAGSSETTDSLDYENVEHTTNSGKPRIKFGPTINARINEGSYQCEGDECLLGGLNGIMFTSLVEYSLIGAAVMYIVWRNIKHEDDENILRREKTQILRINLKNTIYGFVLGVFFLICCIVSMIFYYIYAVKKNEHRIISTTVFSVTDLTTLLVMSIACLFALYRMRVLNFIDLPENEKEEGEESQELLDMILLTIGMIGDLIYSGAGLVGIQKTADWNTITIIVFITLLFRIIQVPLQSILIYIARKLRAEEAHQLKSQPGKQIITFLLLANISLFMMNLFESEKFGVNQTVVQFFGKKNWVYLTRSFSPLTIFYRFHSSVCLAEIWRNTYAVRKNL